MDSKTCYSITSVSRADEGIALIVREPSASAREWSPRLQPPVPGPPRRSTKTRETEAASSAVTGSLNASLAQWLIGAGLARASYVASQGAALGRAGRVHLRKEAEQVWVGGDVVEVVRGELLL